MKAQMTIFAPTVEEAKKELAAIAVDCGATPRILKVEPQGEHNWLVTYTANESTIKEMGLWVS